MPICLRLKTSFSTNWVDVRIAVIIYSIDVEIYIIKQWWVSSMCVRWTSNLLYQPHEQKAAGYSLTSTTLSLSESPEVPQSDFSSLTPRMTGGRDSCVSQFFTRGRPRSGYLARHRFFAHRVLAIDDGAFLQQKL